jgi:GT2 family glycosyltransferase
LYDVPFRAVVLSHNVGFSGVNNIGAELARGRLLLLLNSDVFPRDAGWLGEMSKFYDSTPGIGALGVKLLYEDDSIQHAGLYFRKQVDSGLWNNEHYYKGLARTLPAANVAREVPAVTAACMMIDLVLYRELRGMYIQGDYEDSDLCLRLAKAGRQNWYLPRVELYHLEGQSYPSQLRQLAGDYNKWLHTSTWKSGLKSIRGSLQ